VVKEDDKPTTVASLTTVATSHHSHNLRMIINCNNSVGCNSLWGYNLGGGDVLLRVIRIRTWRLDCTLTFCSIDCYNLIHLLIVHSSLDVLYFNHLKTNDAGTRDMGSGLSRP
jgi:hypothetical protein